MNADRELTVLGWEMDVKNDTGDETGQYETVADSLHEETCRAEGGTGDVPFFY